MTRRIAFVLAACAAVLNPGCSAVVSPDPSRFDGIDGGSDGLDAGDAPQSDGGSGSDARVETDGAPACPSSCDDDVPCTVDTCEAGVCRHAPDDSLCEGTDRCSAALGCVPARCSSDAECDDGVGCTVDRCDPDSTESETGCVSTADDARCASADFCTVGATCSASAGCVGGSPRACTDGDLCTMDRCDSVAGACVSDPLDADGDGFAAQSATGAGGPTRLCGGPDCDDASPEVNPDATEACNGRDDDCDGASDEGCAPLPDDCEGAEAIVLDGTGRGSASGSFAALADDYTPSLLCNPRSGGRDAVYYFDLPSGTWDVTVDTIGASADTVLGVGFACSAEGLGIACNDDYAGSGGPTESRVWLHRVGAGSSGTRVYVLVDAYDGAVTGDYQVNVQRAPARADACPTSTGGTPLDISGGGTIVGFQTGLTGSQRGSCQPISAFGGEAVFFVRGPASGNVDFDVYSTDFTPDVYLRARPCTSGTELGCDAGASIGGGVSHAELRESVTSGDAHFFIVDGGRGSYAVVYTPR